MLVGEGLLQLLGAVDDGRGVLVVLEDLHWSDPETLDVVEYLVDNLGDQPVLCVLTTRPDLHAAVPERLGALVVRGFCWLRNFSLAESGASAGFRVMYRACQGRGRLNAPLHIETVG